MLLFQRTQARFPAPHGGSQPSLTLVPGGSSALFWPPQAPADRVCPGWPVTQYPPASAKRRISISLLPAATFPVPESLLGLMPTSPNTRGTGHLQPHSAFGEIGEIESGGLSLVEVRRSALGSPGQAWHPRFHSSLEAWEE